MDNLTFEQSNTISTSSEAKAKEILNSVFASDFVSTVGTPLDYENCVDLKSRNYKVAWRNLNDKYGHELTLKYRSWNLSGDRISTEYEKIIRGQSKADYALYTFFHDNPQNIKSWIIIDSNILAKHIKQYASFNFKGRKYEQRKTYDFLKIRIMWLRMIGAVVQEWNIIDSPSYKNEGILDGGESEKKFFEEML